MFGNLPILGESSNRVARLAAAVGLQDHLFELVEVIFTQAPRSFDDASLRRLAAAVPGVDVERAMEDRSSPAVDAILAEARTMAQQFSVHGTPTFLIGKTGSELHVQRSARAALPETLIAPIEALLQN